MNKMVELDAAPSPVARKCSRLYLWAGAGRDASSGLDLVKSAFKAGCAAFTAGGYAFGDPNNFFPSIRTPALAAARVQDVPSLLAAGAGTGRAAARERWRGGTDIWRVRSPGKCGTTYVIFPERELSV